MPNLYALLVGINSYHPDLNINSLSGCLNDVGSFSKYLGQVFPESQRDILQLLDEQATREQVISTFKAHLIYNNRIQPGDTVLFYFSGHGSHAMSNPAFNKFDARQRDETLVLYDSRRPGNFDLADKEIALLLHKVPAGANIVVIIDACHSGSITRSADTADVNTLGRAKFSSPHREPRPLRSYLSLDDDLNYEKMEAAGKLEIPFTRHIVLSACDRGELAYESADQPTALFSSALLKALNNAAAPPSYTALYEHVFALLRRRARRQSPQLRVYEGFNPDCAFLGNAILDSEPVYGVTYENGLWTVNCGAIHGLRNDAAAMEGTAVSIYVNNDKTLRVRVAAVGLNRSELPDLPIFNRDKVYPANVSLPPVVSIALKATPQEADRWTQMVKEEPFRYKMSFFPSDSGAAADYVLAFEGQRIGLYSQSGAFVHGIEGTTDDAMAYMYGCCKQVCSWSQLLLLENKAMSEKMFLGDFKTTFAIDLLLDPATDSWQRVTGTTTLCLKEGEKIPRYIRLENNSGSNWYAAVYYLSSAYSIKRRTPDIDAAILKKDEILPGLEKQGNLRLLDELEEDIVRFKLLISKEPFYDHFIYQYEELEPLFVPLDYATAGHPKNLAGASRGTADMEASVDQDWYAQTITIRLVRAEGKIGEQQSFSVGNISINAHPQFSATVGIDAATAGKSVHPAVLLQETLTANGFEVIDINTLSKQANRASNIITLSDIQQADSLRDQPLIVKLQQDALTDNVAAMAVTMVDGIIIPLGVGARENGQLVFGINTLPEEQSATAEGEKNLLRAVWFCLVKTITRKNPSMLREVFYDKGTTRYSNEPPVILPGTKVLLIVHGIIGNTKEQATCMEFLHREQQYNQVIAYDYENLNTRIELMADDLCTQLKKAGIGAANVRLDIVAHSMGGLISRYMIEHIAEAEGWVTNLYMFGTPNGGSAFGKIPKLHSRMMGVLMLACNAGKGWLGRLAPVLGGISKALSATLPLTNSLAQMDEDSDFYKLLNASPVNKKIADYFIIAGNLHEYEPEDKNWFGRLSENIKLQVGNWVYGDIDNDIAVSVESIGHVPHGRAVTKAVVGCHHMNYFEAAASVNYFKKLKATRPDA